MILQGYPELLQVINSKFSVNACLSIHIENARGLGSEKTIGFRTGKRETDEYSVKTDVSIPLLLLIILMTIGHVNERPTAHFLEVPDTISR